MDAYSISVTSPAQRNTSRIYQDLKSAQNHFILEFSAHPGGKSLSRCLEPVSGMSSTSPHVGIIGAGLAGLRCADALLQSGFRVTILEARRRLGGRLYQETLPNGHLVDMGPNWIHGTVDNPMMELAKETGTKVGQWDNSAWILDEEGSLLSSEDSDAYSDIMWEIIKEAFEHSNKHCQEIDPSESLLDFFQTKVKERIPESTEAYEKKRYMVLQMSLFWGAFVGSPIERQSLKYFWLEECLDGENLFCAGTYRKILEKIASPAVAGAEISYGVEVTKIYGKSASGTEGGAVRVTAGSRTFEFDEVVVTTPLGWLKKNPSAFVPPLPEKITNAIHNIGYGCLEKVYISFPAAFWLQPDPTGRKVQGFCQWLPPKYAADSNPKRWTTEAVDLGSLDPPNAHPTLLFYMYGEESEYVTSEARARAAKGERDTFLFEFFRPYYSRLPNYDHCNPDCQPSGAVATDWLHDGLAGNGSYSNFPVGLREGDKDLLAMRAGVPGEGIWLAGEHTAPFVALGTATGAYWSGDLVAKRIARAYDREGPA